MATTGIPTVKTKFRLKRILTKKGELSATRNGSIALLPFETEMGSQVLTGFLMLARGEIQVRSTSFERLWCIFAHIKASLLSQVFSGFRSSSSEEIIMSSREIVELTDKRHDNVMADIRKMLGELGLNAPDFSGVYKDQQPTRSTWIYVREVCPKLDTLAFTRASTS